MKILWWTVLALIAVVVILFAVSNREIVSVGLWPLPDFAAMPLYLVVLGCLLIGFVCGQLSSWLGGWRWRRELRQARDRIAALEQELAEIRAQQGPHTPVAALPR